MTSFAAWAIAQSDADSERVMFEQRDREAQAAYELDVREDPEHPYMDELYLGGEG